MPGFKSLRLKPPTPLERSSAQRIQKLVCLSLVKRWGGGGSSTRTQTGAEASLKGINCWTGQAQQPGGGGGRGGEGGAGFFPQGPLCPVRNRLGSVSLCGVGGLALQGKAARVPPPVFTSFSDPTRRQGRRIFKCSFECSPAPGTKIPESRVLSILVLGSRAWSAFNGQAPGTKNQESRVLSILVLGSWLLASARIQLEFLHASLHAGKP